MIYDVARLAGVSHQTVSRVINESRSVRPDTRARVLAAMEKLDYRPNSVARALSTGRSQMLGVMTFNTTLYGPASTLLGIESAAHAAGYAAVMREHAANTIHIMRQLGTPPSPGTTWTRSSVATRATTVALRSRP